MDEKGLGISGIILLLALPWLITIIILGRTACPVSKEPCMEDYVAAVTSSQIEWNVPMEAIKAQTVIARSNLYLEWKKGKAADEIKSASEFIKKKGKEDFFLENFRKFQDAAAETKNQVLMQDGNVKEIPYHNLSQGKTRDGKEVLGEDFSYVPSVETPKDTDSPLYVKGCYYNLEELNEKIKKAYAGFSMSDMEEIEIKNTDSTGYVLTIQMGNQEFQGENLREILNLPSSCFTIQVLDEEVRFLCKGIGHGIGLSQYTASCMAKEEKDYKEILACFFPDLEIKEIKME